MKELLKRLIHRTPAAPVEAPEAEPKADCKLRTAKGAQAAAARRIDAFAKDHPELHRLYFTKAGIRERQEATREVA